MNNNLIIESITCPITHIPMTDPVQGIDGHTYERAAIISALQIKQESPITRQYMLISDLKVNHAIKYICDKYHTEFSNNNNNNMIQYITQETTTNEKFFNNDIKLLEKLEISHDRKNLLLTFNVDENTIPQQFLNKEIPQDIVLLIDRSGSMGLEVKAKDANGSSLETCLSVQNIVNHSAKTIINTLNHVSRLAIIAFDNKIVIMSDLISMTQVNKNNITNDIDTIIKPRGQTNIWGGIQSAVKILDNRTDKSRNASIFMLTDGLPNISPARGEIETLKRLREKNSFTTPIYTFGFGYNLSKGLLYDMAKYSGGCNGHIPDGSMIATVFCNFISNILTTVVCDLKLYIDTKEIYLLGDFPKIYDSEKNVMIYDIGCIHYQQSRNISIRLVNDASIVDNFQYYYTYNIGDKYYITQPKTCIINNIEENNINVTINTNRYLLVQSIRYMINYMINYDYNQAHIAYEYILKVLKSVNNPDKLTQGMIKNLMGDEDSDGQIKLAISEEYFNKWGRFYLDQLSRSLNQEIKPNFKDEGCIFGGKVFEDIVDHSSDIFDTLPPPIPSINRAIYSSLSNSNTPLNSGINMSIFNNIGGGCFNSICLITMKTGDKIKLSDLKPNDEIMSSDLYNNITTSRVLCILERIITNSSKEREMVNLPKGLSITPWHPIKYKNNWTFPNNIKSPEITKCNSIITLLLDNNHIGYINGYQCIMLGHNYNDSLLKHEYYGTKRIVNDMKKHPHWKKGHIIVNDVDDIFNP